MILFDKEISDNHRIRPEVRRVLAVQLSATEFELTRFFKMRTADGLEEFGTPSGVTVIDGVARWVSNSHVPPLDAVQYYGIDQLPGFDLVKTNSAREAETTAFLNDYRAANANRQYSSEEISEMRAAFEPGAEVVNVVTGKRTKL
jgi:hypothetical protein